MNADFAAVGEEHAFIKDDWDVSTSSASAPSPPKEVIYGDDDALNAFFVVAVKLEGSKKAGPEDAEVLLGDFVAVSETLSRVWQCQGSHKEKYMRGYTIDWLVHWHRTNIKHVNGPNATLS